MRSLDSVRPSFPPALSKTLAYETPFAVIAAHGPVTTTYKNKAQERAVLQVRMLEDSRYSPDGDVVAAGEIRSLWLTWGGNKAIVQALTDEPDDPIGPCILRRIALANGNDCDVLGAYTETELAFAPSPA
jgi:hypothetical protein